MTDLDAVGREGGKASVETVPVGRLRKLFDQWSQERSRRPGESGVTLVGDPFNRHAYTQDGANLHARLDRLERALEMLVEQVWRVGAEVGLCSGSIERLKELRGFDTALDAIRKELRGE